VFFLTPTRCAPPDESSGACAGGWAGGGALRSVLVSESVLRDAVLILGSVASGNDLAVRRSGRSAAASSAVRSKGRAIKVFMPVWTPPLGASPSSGVLRPAKK